jgi:hypothetical protein
MILRIAEGCALFQFETEIETFFENLPFLTLPGAIIGIESRREKPPTRWLFVYRRLLFIGGFYL